MDGGKGRRARGQEGRRAGGQAHTTDWQTAVQVEDSRKSLGVALRRCPFVFPPPTFTLAGCTRPL